MTALFMLWIGSYLVIGIVLSYRMRVRYVPVKDSFVPDPDDPARGVIQFTPIAVSPWQRVLCGLFWLPLGLAIVVRWFKIKVRP